MKENHLLGHRFLGSESDNKILLRRIILFAQILMINKKSCLILMKYKKVIILFKMIIWMKI